LDGDGENIYEYKLRDVNTVDTETRAKIVKMDKSAGIVQYHIGTTWTLEYALNQSLCLKGLFKTTIEAVHSKTDWITNFESKLAEKLINKSLDKTEIAYRLAKAINDLLVMDPSRVSSPLKEINQADGSKDSIGYVLNAIRHASGN
jgi:putative ATP-dependent endonuclease of OLD family